jgi:hypothetical protein
MWREEKISLAFCVVSEREREREMFRGGKGDGKSDIIRAPSFIGNFFRRFGVAIEQRQQRAPPKIITFDIFTSFYRAGEICLHATQKLSFTLRSNFARNNNLLNQKMFHPHSVVMHHLVQVFHEVH